MILAQIAPLIFGLRPEFLLFGLTLLGVALFHRYTLFVGLIGLTSILLFKFIFIPEFNLVEHLFGHVAFSDQILHKEMRVGEWSVLLNLFGLLIGFALLSWHFEKSGLPDYLPQLLPNDWKGPLVLLIAVFVLSSFLDNIAAALIGGTIAMVVFKHKVHLGYIAAIVAASNAGGSGSVIGDTTTTLMWIQGVSPFNVLHAYVAAFTALAFFSIFASIQQDKYQRIQKDATPNLKIDWGRIGIVALILLMTILTNVFLDFPALGVWVAIGIGAFIRVTDWKEAKNAIAGSIFLLSLVTCASLMPVEELPAASWQSAFSLGFVSAVFDNIPLTKLALEQNGYDWGMLAYAVGFGGSMVWFGSSAGVAISSKFHEARSVFGWLKAGWHIIVAYILGFFVLLFFMGWEPLPYKKKSGDTTPPPTTEQQMLAPENSK
ncbi:Na+/H+ antiporter NhaD type [Aquipluma nitroreducens]|uniref:Na+/H+ antiporter NhaD type n=1 Tax=Aquipluma nitroreducens TaxID=2010828 RepID=A0A5K7SDB4_9BACT|nr:SLC13 family permease [Aquipluma nitroreducens]BBE19560.1 Na+/H+ antiporter NhaD type [Aquipluma nitroreducens]